METLGVGDITNTGAALNGNVYLNNGFDIVDHGFMWSPNQHFSFSSYNRDILRLGKFNDKGEFTGEITRGMATDQIIYYRAFIATDSHTIVTL